MDATNTADRLQALEDTQVVTALRSLGHDVFPFTAFDAAGRLTQSPNVTKPLKRELDEVLKAPDWRRVFETVSLLDNPGHQATHLGFRLDDKGVSLIAVRSVRTLRAPTNGLTWYNALADTVLRTVQGEAGKKYFVKPSWIDAIRQILSIISGQREELVRTNAREPDFRALFSLSLALEFILSVLEVANRFGRRHDISTIVVWEYPAWYPRFTAESGKRWAPLGTVVNDGGRNVGGLIWDRMGRTTWNWAGSQPWYGLRVHPQSIHRAWYPSGLAGTLTDENHRRNPGARPAPAARPLRSEAGIASWYDCRGLRAAHRTLPFGTEVRVTNVANRRSVTVRINDRGPFVPGRIIDLCRPAFARIAPISAGIARVRIEW